MPLNDKWEVREELVFALDAGNLVCNDVLRGGDVIGEEADGIVDHKAALEAPQCAPHWGVFAGLLGPGFADGIVT